LDELPERTECRNAPALGMPDFAETIYVSVGRRPAACRNRRTLFTESTELGYVGCYSGLQNSPAKNRGPECRFPVHGQWMDGHSISGLSDCCWTIQFVIRCSLFAFSFSLLTNIFLPLRNEIRVVVVVLLISFKYDASLLNVWVHP
jgi:hypothetical protein